MAKHRRQRPTIVDTSAYVPDLAPGLSAFADILAPPPPEPAVRIVEAQRPPAARPDPEQVYRRCELDWPRCHTAAAHRGHPDALSIAENPNAPPEHLRRASAVVGGQDALFFALCRRRDLDKQSLVRLASVVSHSRLHGWSTCASNLTTSRIERRALALLDHADLPADAVTALIDTAGLSDLVVLAIVEHPRTNDFHLVHLVRRLASAGASGSANELLALVSDLGGPVALAAVHLVRLKRSPSDPSWDDKQLLRASRTILVRIGGDPEIAREFLTGLAPTFGGTVGEIAEIASLLA